MISGVAPPLRGGGAPHFSHMSREICPMSAQILNDRGGASAAGAADQQGGAHANHRGARELSSKRCSTKSPPTGGERAHQQEALQHQVSTHRGRESSSAAGAPAPNLQPQGARELSSRRSSAKSPTTGGAREELKSSRGTDIIPYPGGGGPGPGTYMGGPSEI